MPNLKPEFVPRKGNLVRLTSVEVDRSNDRQRAARGRCSRDRRSAELKVMRQENLRDREVLIVSVSLHVGWLDEMRQCDAEGYRYAKDEFAAINETLRKQGLPEYSEPDDTRGESWWFQLYPSNGIAFLQRFAAHCQYGE